MWTGFEEPCFGSGS